jgi:hypothetical protein
MTKQRTKRRKTNKDDNDTVIASEDTPTTCPVCCNDTDESCIQCKVCSVFYHAACVNISVDVLRALRPIIPVVGWVCTDCLGLLSSAYKSLKTEITALKDALHTLQARHSELAVKVEGLLAVKTVAEPPVAYKGLISVAVQDSLRRKKNVVVCGVPENVPGISDAQLFRNICSTWLDIKPWIDEAKCRRVGRNTPRRLLITLASEQSATELIQSAKLLRSAPVGSMESGIYINADLSPEEAKRAYEKRKERKAKQGQPAGVSGLPASTSVTMSILPSSPVIAGAVGCGNMLTNITGSNSADSNVSATWSAAPALKSATMMSSSTHWPTAGMKMDGQGMVTAGADQQHQCAPMAIGGICPKASWSQPPPLLDGSGVQCPAASEPSVLPGLMVSGSSTFPISNCC